MSQAAQAVIDVLRGQQRASVRLMTFGEALPSGLDLGFDHLGALDPSWVWVAERAGRIEWRPTGVPMSWYRSHLAVGDCSRNSGFVSIEAAA